MDTHKLTETQIAGAVAYGVLAFHRGIKRAPILDVQFAALEYWSDMPIMLAWLHGWDTANLSSAISAPARS